VLEEEMSMNVRDPAMPAERYTTHTERAGLATAPVSMEPYRSPEFYALEQERIFRRAWLLLAREEEIGKVGDYVRKEVEVCNASVILTRAKDGKVRAFHNVCSHRGNQVVVAESGNASRLMCRYHQWTYATDGRLLTIPDESSFFNVDKKNCGLTPIACEVWEGWVFINFAPVPEVGVREYLGDLADYFSGVHYLNAANPFIVQADLDCNWKVVSDAFCEAYHIPAIHPQTIGATFSSNDNPYAHILDAKFFGPHRFVSMYGNSEYKPGPNNKVEALAYASIDSSTSVLAHAKGEDIARFLEHPGINPTRSKDWAMDALHVWPNMHIDTGPGGFWTHHFWPLSYNRTRHEIRFYVSKAENMRERFQQEAYVARVCEVLLEDLSNVARTQRGLESRAKGFMQLQDNEVLIRANVATVQKWVEATTLKEALA
jgi:phenylpropionate dioxygenase-like ring-hydroxylating dioxygenase large terminal subunit